MSSNLRYTLRKKAHGQSEGTAHVHYAETNERSEEVLPGNTSDSDESAVSPAAMMRQHSRSIDEPSARTRASSSHPDETLDDPSARVMQKPSPMPGTTVHRDIAPSLKNPRGGSIAPALKTPSGGSGAVGGKIAPAMRTSNNSFTSAEMNRTTPDVVHATSRTHHDTGGVSGSKSAPVPKPSTIDRLAADMHISASAPDDTPFDSMGTGADTESREPEHGHARGSNSFRPDEHDSEESPSLRGTEIRSLVMAEIFRRMTSQELLQLAEKYDCFAPDQNRRDDEFDSRYATEHVRPDATNELTVQTRATHVTTVPVPTTSPSAEQAVCLGVPGNGMGRTPVAPPAAATDHSWSQDDRGDPPVTPHERQDKAVRPPVPEMNRPDAAESADAPLSQGAAPYPLSAEALAVLMRIQELEQQLTPAEKRPAPAAAIRSSLRETTPGRSVGMRLPSPVRPFDQIPDSSFLRSITNEAVADSASDLSEPSSDHSSDSAETKKLKRKKRKAYRKRRDERKREDANTTAVEPFKYNGDADFGVYKSWVYQVKEYLRVAHIHPKRQVLQLQYFLTGDACTFFNQEVIETPDPRVWYLDDFIEELFNFCFPANFRTLQRDRFAECRQDGRKVRDWVAELRALAASIGDVSD